MAIEITELKKRATMINDKVRMYLLPPLFNAAVRAGASIMNIYKNLDDYDISLKDDKTPITLADRLAHKTIREYLGRTRIPILSEEGREMRYDERRNWELYWLVDPLDGTVEFIKGNNEFTVNIALMENNVCMGAVIYVPYFEKMYVAGRDSGSYVKEHIAPDAAAEYTYDQIVTGWRQPPPQEGGGHPPRCRGRSTPACGWPCRGRTRRPKRRSISPACAKRIPIWRSSSRGVPTNSACWPRGRSIIMSARRIRTSGTLPRAS